MDDAQDPRRKHDVAGVLPSMLPSLLILIALSWIYMAYGKLPAIAGLLYGIKPAVTAIVVFAAYRIGSRALKNAALWSIAAAAFIAIFALKLPFPYIVLAAGIVGFLGGRYAPARFAIGGGHAATDKRYGAAIIDDDTPTPPHALFTWARIARVSIAGLALWGGAMALLCARYGWDRDAHPNGLVFYQSRAAHVRRRLRGAAVRVSGRRRAIRGG